MEAILVAPFVLGTVEREIAPAPAYRRCRRIGRIGRNPDTRGDVHFAAPDSDRARPARREPSMPARRHSAGSVRFDLQNGELVAAQTGEQIVLAKVALEGARRPP